MVLLEREPMLSVLDGCRQDAAGGQGRMVLLAGEAGAGKTSLARAFSDRHRSTTEVWWGACDALLTPAPLGPLYDIGRDGNGKLAGLLAGDASQHDLFAGFLETLAAAPRPVIVVIEDVHWADQSTLDLLVYLGRRVAGTQAVAVVTYRDDELGLDHPLRQVLGRLATAGPVRRLSLPRLSGPATAALTDAAAAAGGHRIDPARVFEVTGGNPFFVTELLATPPGAVPETVRDAVLSRVAQLSPPARAALGAASIVPDRAELALVAAVTGREDLAAVEECEQAGMLSVAGHAVSFRHELARQVVADAVPAARLPGLHAAALAYLVGQPEVDLARLVYHADQAGDPDAVLAYAPAAAAHASRLGAHAEAVAHYQRALRHAGTWPAGKRADLLERYAEECGAVAAVADGIAAMEQVVALRQECGELAGAAKATVRLAQFLFTAGRGREAFVLVDEALALVAGQPASPAVAAVYSHAAYLHMVRDDGPRARELGTRAVALAEQFGDDVLLAAALQAVGGVQWMTDPDRAGAAQARAVAAAHRAGGVATVARSTGGYGQGALNARRYRTADQWLARAVDWCTRHDLDRMRDFYRANQAESAFDQGRWAEAAELVDQLMTAGAGTFPAAYRLAQVVRGRLAVRRGDPDQRGPLAAAWQAATASGTVVGLWPVAAARAEVAWQTGRAGQIPALVTDTYQLALRTAHPWAIGELALWLWRASALDSPPPGAAEPYRLHLAGQPAAAAAAWDRIGCPYEAAMARADSGDPGLMKAALAEFHRLGARPAANRLVHKLRRRGITDLPRRPHRSTGANPGGLTDRELDVAGLLAQGLSNADIAVRLHISPRTVGHHVAAVLGKLKVPTRQQVADALRSL